MSEHKSGPVETGAEMDYDEHEKAYGLFINGAKYGAMIVVCLLIAMAAGFFTSFNLFTSFILFIVLNIVGYFLIR